MTNKEFKELKQNLSESFGTAVEELDGMTLREALNEADLSPENVICWGAYSDTELDTIL